MNEPAFYFVYYSSGCCQHGDCSTDIEKFKTLEEAEKFMDQYRASTYEPTLELIYGSDIKLGVV